MKNNQQGFLKIIIIIVIALVVLGYYNVDVRKVVNSPMVRENLAYGKDMAVAAYTYIVEKIKSI